jgi:tetratricopeptide (TPR) repeat protein
VRGLAVSVVFVSLWVMPAGASHGAPQHDGSAASFEQQRQAALDQVAWVEQAYAERLGPRGAEWRARIKAEEAALLESLEWFSQNAEGDQALRLAVPLGYFWTYDGRAVESRVLLDKVIALPSAAAPTLIRARALYDAGQLALGQEDQPAARASFDESLRIYRRLDDKGGMAMAQVGLSRIALRDLDFASVRRYAEESAVLRRDLGDTRGQASAMHVLAAAARMQGQYSKAAELYQFSLDANRKGGYEDAVAAESLDLGYVRLRQGRIAEAKTLFTDSLRTYRTLQDDTGIAFSLTGFAALAVEQKQPTRAARLYGASLAILDRLHVTFEPDEQFEIDHYTAKLLTLLAPAAFDDASTEGRATSPERAIALALGAF